MKTRPLMSALDPKRTPLAEVLRLVAIVSVVVLVWGFFIPDNVHAADAPITLNLENADIGVLIATVSKFTGKNFVIDPRVKGKVTVISAHAMGKDEIYRVFLSVLEVHGYATVPMGSIIKIIPDAKAKQEATPVAGPHQYIGDQAITRVIALKHVTAAQLVPVLRPLVPQEGHLAAYPEGNVLVISDRAANVDRLVRVIHRIDQPSTSDIEVIRLQHASATDLVQTLGTLEQKGGAKSTVATTVRLLADPRTNSILLSGSPAERLRMRALISHLDTPLESGGSTHVIYLHYAKAKDLVPVLTGVSDSMKKGGTNSQSTKTAAPINIQADDSANALVVTAPPDISRSLEAVVRKLDIRRAQVLVEAVIAEVSVDKSRELGVQWLLDRTPGNSGFATGTNFDAGGTSISSIAADVKNGNIPNIGVGLSLGIGRLGDTSSYGLLLRALANDANTNILSTPSLMTLDNQEAEIVVGQNVPFVTGQYASTGNTTTVNPFQTIQRQDVGLTLKVTPQINEGDAVKLEIEQIVSSISPSSVGAADIITNKRSIKTTVMVEDGNIIVLGGLIDDQLQETKQKVPLLGDIPLLGKLFRYDKTSKVKRNLMVFLRPVIVRDAATTAAVTGGKYDAVRTRQLEMRRHGISLLPRGTAPVLPKRPTSGKSASPSPEQGSPSPEINWDEIYNDN